MRCRQGKNVKFKRQDKLVSLTAFNTAEISLRLQQLMHSFHCSSKHKENRCMATNPCFIGKGSNY